MNHVAAQHQQDTDRFYSLLDALAEQIGGARRLFNCSAASGWPQRGVYFFFEDGETRTDGDRPRVVRVGSHALTATSHTTLWTRLAQHRGPIDGTNPRGGNQRGSIFRRHAGTALHATGHWPSEIAQSWPKNHVTSSNDKPNAPSNSRSPPRSPPYHCSGSTYRTETQRSTIEANAIALLSQRTGAVDPPSPGWLGLHAANPKVRSSGLWNSNHVDDRYDPSFLDDIALCMKTHPR
ncbi:hypothetical protein [Nonomuraea sp. 10N515B]|uniref:hypothetical protein n=1 Tax=Nonomuraea sp. 10N515B TaxID=3457422 RepID=UPI003FCD527D